MSVRERLGKAGRRVARHESWLWVAVAAVVLAIQWPMLKGLYYRTTGSPAPASAIAWRTDLDAALGEARGAGRLVFVDFSADWCPPCIAMKHDVWPDGRVARALDAAYVPVMIDVDRDGATAARYEVEGIPTILVLDGSGRVLRRATFMSAGALARFLEESAPAPRPGAS